jgi:hypothetical protein
MTIALFDSLSHYCHNIETGNEDDSARHCKIGKTKKPIFGRVMQNMGQNLLKKNNPAEKRALEQPETGCLKKRVVVSIGDNVVGVC